ncbi:MAG TPA: hypothetical protein VHJ38_12105 [Nitrososphaeraceae archaeon]|jgi:hypothetical protein|nr:hypothetical protein [Nitrososphaeraceae archaeon]
MQRILAILSLLTILSSVYFLIFQNVLGNGIRNNFGIDYLPPLNLNDTSLSLNVEFQPSMTKSNINEKRSIIFKLIDIDKNITYIPNLYKITILKNGYNNGKITEKVFLNGLFFSKNGTLILQFDSNKTNNIDNNVNKELHNYNIDKDHNDKVIRSNENGIVVINKPGLDSGIYRLKVNVNLSNTTAADVNKNIILKFDSYLSLGNILDLEIGKPDKKLTILSFNDKILRYDYDQESKKISFDIPFTYNMTRIEEGFIYIHVEIKIPNTFNEFFNAKEYSSTINNIDHSKISSASVSIDRYSNSSNVTVHFILDSNSLFKLTKEREKYSDENSDMTLQFSLQPK